MSGLKIGNQLPSLQLSALEPGLQRLHVLDGDRLLAHGVKDALLHPTDVRQPPRDGLGLVARAQPRVFSRSFRKAMSV